MSNVNLIIIFNMLNFFYLIIGQNYESSCLNTHKGSSLESSCHFLGAVTHQGGRLGKGHPTHVKPTIWALSIIYEEPLTCHMTPPVCLLYICTTTNFYLMMQ